MLSRSFRNILSLPSKNNYYLQSKNMIGLNYSIKYSFFKNSNNQDEEDSNKVPEGFEKFKRRTKKKTEQTESEQTVEQLEKGEKKQKQVDQEEDPFKQSNRKGSQSEEKQGNKSSKQRVERNDEANESESKDQDEDDKEVKSDNRQNDKKKWGFTYKPNIFKQEDKKGNKNEQKNQEDENQNEKNKKDEEEKEEDHQKQENQNKNQEQSSSDFQQKMKNFWNNGNNKKFIIAGLAITVLGPALYSQYESQQFISYADFVKTYLHTDNVRAISIQRLPIGNSLKTYAKIVTKDGSVKKITLGNIDNFLESVENYQIEKGRDAETLIPISFEYLVDLNKTLDYSFSWLSTIITISIGYVFYKSMKSGFNSMKGGGGGGGQDIFGMGKSNVKVFGVDTKVTTRFKDVAGQDEAKKEIQEFVEFLKKPAKYKAIGAKLPKGALLTGPPGTGKTLLAKACAGEAGVPFFFISGSDFVEMFVGVGASRVRDLFKQAKHKSPSIIFIDEIDAVGRKRESKMGGNDERDNTLNQLLVEMDGFGTDANVIVLAATNRKELLDPALTRPGRFDRTIEISNPDIDGRKQIFMVHLKPLKLDPSKTMEDYAKRLATLTPGFSGADIMNLCNEAAILAARKNKKFIESIDFELASERVIGGLEKKKIVSEEERKIVAVHESGHAVTSWFLEGGYPLLKLTIIPRTKGSLGFAQYLPNESSLESKNELLDRLCTILGGRCAEEEFFGRVTTGAYDDLKRAHELCHDIVTKYGMSEKLGYIGYIENEYSKTYSDYTNKLIDEEIKRLVDEATVKTRDLIKKYRQKIEGLSSTLLEKETLDLRQITAILGDRPYPPKSNYKAYLDLQQQDEAEKIEEEAKSRIENEGQHPTDENQEPPSENQNQETPSENQETPSENKQSSSENNQSSTSEDKQSP